MNNIPEGFTNEVPKVSQHEIFFAAHTSSLDNSQKMTWPDNVIEDLRKYNPNILALDSLTSGLPQEMQDSMFNIPLVTEIPGLKILRGDPLSYMVNIPNLPFDKKLELVDQANNRILNPLRYAELIPPLIASAAMLHLVSHARTSRRNFLKLGGAVVLTATLAKPIMQICAGISPSNTKSPYNMFVEKLMPYVDQQDWWLNGRTAILASKGIEQSKMNDGPKVATLLGTAHIANSLEINTDTNTRQWWIKEFIDKSSANIYEFKDFMLENDRNTSLVEIRKSIKEYCASYDIVTSQPVGNHIVYSPPEVFRCEEILEC